ncbi:hypothetical protein BCR34DRAFT_606643 [Clohesyomyces aquaticus]|uniref:Uncharacterized protein n=1 Tax=Clohesyomyces aquaticus TaxID=1231657 RepID=A0A1Y1YN71_9PLEO|nr:hypothetical protein BCR34DRAFT_606643 [Clohesyomyces aquaticus]
MAFLTRYDRLHDALDDLALDNDDYGDDDDYSDAEGFFEPTPTPAALVAIAPKQFKEGRAYRYGDQVPSGNDGKKGKKDTIQEDSPIWCNVRVGGSITVLPDGTKVCIGGGHEYGPESPDTTIYNDVIVHCLAAKFPGSKKKSTPKSAVSGGVFTINGYPKDVFPSTHYHSATYHEKDSSIYIVGNKSTPDDASATPVYRLSTTDWSITAMKPSGESPGKIFEHEAKLKGNEIRVMGGKCVGMKDGKDEQGKGWVLNLTNTVWRVVQLA